MSRYQTNLASEFHVLSILYRLGADATLTLGNKKSVDIVVVREGGDAVTIDVKGLAGKYDWPADNIRTTLGDKHFIVLVSYDGRIGDPHSVPSTWVIPSDKLDPFIKQFKTRRDVSRSRLLQSGACYKDAWHLVLGE